MFEVHTRDRVYLLSAPTEDEMQSWVGMVQTLKQYDKQRKQTSRGNHAWSFQNSSPRLPPGPGRRAASEGHSDRRNSHPQKNAEEAEEEEEEEEEGEENGTDIPQLGESGFCCSPISRCAGYGSSVHRCHNFRQK